MAQYDEHAKFLAEIGVEVLKGNQNIFKINGIKEIIGLYLLIPYITPDRLDPPEGSAMPKLRENFATAFCWKIFGIRFVILSLPWKKIKTTVRSMENT